MSEVQFETEDEATEEAAVVSKRRETIATVVAVVVTIVVSGASGMLIDKLQKKVHDHIAPPAEDEDE